MSYVDLTTKEKKEDYILSRFEYVSSIYICYRDNEDKERDYEVKTDRGIEKLLAVINNKNVKK